MKLGLGIDTGGTYTDSVIVDLDSGNVLSKAKAQTTREDLRIGIDNSLSLLDENLFSKINLVSLSTTLATNSVVEGKGSRVGLIMAVPNPRTFSLITPVPAEETAIIAGAHDKQGMTTAELDTAAAALAIRRMAEKIDAFAVSGYFSIYNAEHEISIRELIASTCSLPVVCGHELSEDVGMMERAVTAALNARLLPIIKELLDAVKQTLHKRSIHAPLMVVKGDGSLVSEEIARARPVETVLSGPAASVVGACRLTGLTDAVVVDMGGTTTDIAVVKNGMAETSRNGAKVGGWQTKVHAVDMSTIGLGGDSMITVNSADDIIIGPRRALPLCSAGLKYPALKQMLHDLILLDGKKLHETGLVFYTLVKMPLFILSKYERLLIESLDNHLLHRSRIDSEEIRFVSIDRFIELGYVAEVSFTPTDLLHAKGSLSLWDTEASKLALSFISKKIGLDENLLLDLLYTKIIESLKLNIAAKVLMEDPALPCLMLDGGIELLSHLLSSNDSGDISASFSIKKKIVAVGAPVKAYFPRAVSELGAGLVVPEHSEVANAFGAITGSIIEKAHAYVRPDKPSGFIVVAAEEQKRFRTLGEAVTFGEKYVRAEAAKRIKLSGGSAQDVTVTKEEKVAPLSRGWGDNILIELKLTATAVGKPSL